MRSHLSARSRLTLLYASLFTLGGAVLALITYLLVAHALPPTTATTIPRAIQQEIAQCVTMGQNRGDLAADVAMKCGGLYTQGVQAGAVAQRSTTLSHLLTYSLLTLAGATLLAGFAGWIAAGRILRPVHRLTAAARVASQQNLSQRIALQGPRDELRELADTFDAMLERLEAAFTSQRQFIANASHELRTPQTFMRTAIDVVLAKPQPTRGELVSMAGDVRRAAGHAERLIEAPSPPPTTEPSTPPPSPLAASTSPSASPSTARNRTTMHGPKTHGSSRTWVRCGPAVGTRSCTWLPPHK